MFNNYGGKKMMMIVIAVGMLCLAFLIFLLFYIKLPASQYRRNLNLGHRYLLAMQYEDAVNAYTEAISIEPKQAEPYVGRGDAYVGLKQNEKAAADYIKAVELEPDLQEEIGKRIKEANIPTPTPTAEPTETPEPDPAADTNVDAKAAETYKAILQEYKKAQDLGYQIEETDYPDVSFRVIQESKEYDPETLKYAFIDLNEDGFPELIFGDSYSNAGSGTEENTLQDGYCYKDGQVQRISDDFISWKRDYAGLYMNHVIGVYHNEGTFKDRYYYQVAADYSMAFIEAYGWDDTNKKYSHWTSENGDKEMISEEEVNAGTSAYQYQTDIPWHDFSEITSEDETVSYSAATKITEGQEMAVDFNGGPDTIWYTEIDKQEDAQDGIRIEINGKTTDLSFDFVTIRPEVYAADINTADGYKNIIVNCPIEDVRETTIVYAYQNNEVSEIGRFDGSFKPDSIKGDGGLETVQIMHWGVQDYGFLCFICGEKIQDLNAEQTSVKAARIQQSADISGIQEGFTAKAQASLPVYSDQACTVQAGTIQSGEEFEINDFYYKSGDGYDAYRVSASGVSGWIPNTYFSKYPQTYIENIMTAA